MNIQSLLTPYINSKHKVELQRFFKTGKGEYGEGDIFIGVKMPYIRLVAKENSALKISEVKKLISSKIHEERMLGLIILVNKFKHFHKIQDEKNSKKMVDIYIKSFKYINNWDLVDVTCPHILGMYFMDKPKDIFFNWAKSSDLWTKRIAMITHWWFIRKGNLETVFKIADILRFDEHDLMHKAVGWMLREAGKKDAQKLKVYLRTRYQEIPRTMLRYSIEKFPEQLRQKYLKGQV